MSYLWSDKITDYYYSNPELDTVAVLWKDEDDKIREHYIKVDDSDQQWSDFIIEVPYEQIRIRTEARHELFREEFREAFRNYAKRPDVNLDGSTATTESINEIVFGFMSAYDDTDAEQKEELFIKYWKLHFLKLFLDIFCLLLIVPIAYCLFLLY